MSRPFWDEDVDHEDEEVTLESVRPYGLYDTVIVFEGVDAKGEAVVVAVDHRPARELRAIIEGEGETVVVSIEDWQILSRVPA